MWAQNVSGHFPAKHKHEGSALCTTWETVFSWNSINSLKSTTGNESVHIGAEVVIIQITVLCNQQSKPHISYNTKCTKLLKYIFLIIADYFSLIDESPKNSAVLHSRAWAVIKLHRIIWGLYSMMWYLSPSTGKLWTLHFIKWQSIIYFCRSVYIEMYSLG